MNKKVVRALIVLLGCWGFFVTVKSSSDHMICSIQTKSVLEWGVNEGILTNDEMNRLVEKCDELVNLASQVGSNVPSTFSVVRSHFTFIVM